MVTVDPAYCNELSPEYPPPSAGGIGRGQGIIFPCRGKEPGSPPPSPSHGKAFPTGKAVDLLAVATHDYHELDLLLRLSLYNIERFSQLFLNSPCNPHPDSHTQN